MSTPASHRWLKRGLAGVVLACLAYGAWSVASAVYYANEAEQTLHACITVTDAIEQYVLDNDGQWPGSWKELSNWMDAAQSLDRADYVRGWSPEWTSRVRVDFAADPAALAKLPIKDYKVEGFRAIEPIGPVFSSFDRHFYLLVEALRQFHGPAPADAGMDRPLN